MIDVKKGASLRLAFQFETDAEWLTLFPAEYAMSQAKFVLENGNERIFDLEVNVDTLSRCIYIKGDTEEWPIGEGEMDIKVINGDLIQTVPELTNVIITVYDGVTE